MTFLLKLLFVDIIRLTIDSLEIMIGIKQAYTIQTD